MLTVNGVVLGFVLVPSLYEEMSVLDSINRPITVKGNRLRVQMYSAQMRINSLVCSSLYTCNSFIHSFFITPYGSITLYIQIIHNER